MSTQSLFVSTTIPYVNAHPHVGFAIELAQADAFVRFRRLQGDRVVFQSGTDENSLKNVLAARARNVPIQEHVNGNAELFYTLASQLGLCLDQFVRTSSPRHHSIVQEFWKLLRPEDIYTKKYCGHYCIGCEDFLRENELDSAGLCRDHRSRPDWIEETNYFFRLSSYQAPIRNLIASDRLRISPAFRKKEVLNFIDAGLDDISITRDRTRSGGWGIPVPDCNEQVVYVWIDALINYLSGFSAPNEWNRFDRRIHFIGKNVWKFHAVYWPALLLSAGFTPPDEIIIHGFLTLDGQKISKSAGNGKDPAQLIQTYGSDSLRFYLLRSFSPFDDGDFSERDLINTHNAFLVNGLGNLLSRLNALVVRLDSALKESAVQSRSLSPDLTTAWESLRFDEGLKVIWRKIDEINTQIATERPWKTTAASSSRYRERITLLITQWLDEVGQIAYWLDPFLPSTSASIFRQLVAINTKQAHLFQKLPPCGGQKQRS